MLKGEFLPPKAHSLVQQGLARKRNEQKSASESPKFWAENVK